MPRQRRAVDPTPPAVRLCARVRGAPAGWRPASSSDAAYHWPERRSRIRIESGSLCYSAAGFREAQCDETDHAEAGEISEYCRRTETRDKKT